MKRALAGLGVALLVIGIALALTWRQSRSRAFEPGVRGAESERVRERTALSALFQALGDPQGTLGVKGRVVGPAGPVSGAVVVALPLLRAGEDPECPCEWLCGPRRPLPEVAPLGRTRSGPDGSYALEGLAPGEVELWATHETEGIATVRPVKVGSSEVEIALAPAMRPPERCKTTRGTRSPERG